MANTLVRKVSLQIRADDGDTQVKLDSISRKAEELSRLHPELKVRIDTAAASAKMGVLRAEMRATAKDAAKSGNDTGQSFISRFGSWLKPSKFQLITSAVASGLAALPALTAGIGALAGVALAAKFLVGTKQAKGPLYGEFTSMTKGLQGVLQNAMTPMIAPLKQAFASIGQFAKQMGPVLKQVFGALGPMVMPLTKGLEGLVSGLLPGFLALMRAAQPAVSAVASLLSGLGKDLGGMLSAFAPAVKASAGVLQAIGTVLNGILPVIGKVAASLAGALAPVLQSLGQAVKALAPAIGIVAKVLGELAGAVLSSLSGALQAVAQLVQAAAPGFTVLANAMGQVFNAMENSGVFGVIENALEGLARPLGNLVSTLVSGLAPILPPLVGAITRLASALTGALINAVTALLPSVTQVVRILAQLLRQVIIPNLPAITQLALSFVKIVIAVTPLLPPLAKLIVLLLQLAVKVITPLTPLIGKLANILTTVANVISTVIGWIAKIIGKGLEWITNFGKVKKAAGDLWNGIKNAFDSILNAGKRLWNGIWNDVIAPVIRGWDKLTSGAQNMGKKIVSFFKGLPKAIVSALGDLGSMMWNAGKHAVSMLVSGLESVPVVGPMVKIGTEILDHLPHSPAKKGPLSGGGSPDIAGRKIASMLAQGISMGTPQVRQAMTHMARAVGGTTASANLAVAGAGGYGGGRVQIEFIGGANDPLWVLFRKNIRIKGGNVNVIGR